MKKKLLFLLIAIQPVLAAHAQKPKATFEFENFAKKAVTYMNMDVTTMCAKDNDLQYIATATGKSLDELKTQLEADKKTLTEDVDFLNKNKILRIFDKAELKVKQETPIKIADIVCYCHYKDKNYTLTLTNCVQTNTTWVLGDGVDPQGDAIAELIALKKTKDAKFANSTLGKMGATMTKLESDALKKDSADRRSAAANSLAARIGTAKAGKLPKGYQARLFPEHDNMPISVYFHTELVDQYLPGYYIDRINGNTFYVDKIKYSEPFTLVTGGPVFDPPQSIASKDVAAFYVGDQLFVQLLPGTQIKVTGYSLGDAPKLSPWVILISEGAIRKVVYVHKISGEIISMNTKANSANQVFQKLDGNVVTSNSLNLQFKKVMVEMVSENAEMAAKIKSGARGYAYMDYENIILEYNQWYDKQFPGKVKYVAASPKDPVELVPSEDDFVSISSKEDLKKYLSQKVWETVAITSYDKTGRTAQATTSGVDRMKSADKYNTYELSANGSMVTKGTPGKWDTKDVKTITLNGSDYMTNITGTTTSTFTADVRREGTQEVETVMFRVQKAL